MKSIADQLARNFPTRNKGRGVRVEPLHDALFGWMKQPLWMLEGVVAFVLLIACANVAGLQLARGATRQTEVAVRAALGAGRWRIVRQFLVESVLLSLLGGVLGAILAWAGLRLLIAISPPWFPLLQQIGINGWVLAFTAALSVLAGVAFGVVPALHASRPNLVESLKEAGRGAMTGLARHRFRGALVAGQIALALILLAGAGLMINSFFRLTGADLGCNPSGVITFDYDFPVSQYVKIVGTYNNYPLLDISPIPAQNFDRLHERIQAHAGRPIGGRQRLSSDAGRRRQNDVLHRRAPNAAKRRGEKRHERGLLSGYRWVVHNAARSLAAWPGFYRKGFSHGALGGGHQSNHGANVLAQ